MKRTCLLSIALLAFACGKSRSGSRTEEPVTQQPEPAAAPTAPAPAEPAASEPVESIDVKDVGLATPESVLHDEAEDVYLVSNINGSPAKADDNGFISRIEPDGKVRELKWIDGAKKEVKLSAPKGMALLGDTLYVADITAVRMFDRKTGAPRGEVAIKGASFLNDLVAAGDAVYVTDSGLKPDFKPSGTDAIHKIDASGKATVFIKDDKLGAPNGLAPAEDGLWLVTFGSGEVVRIAADGTKQAPTRLPKGQLDGVVALANGTLLISSWEARAIMAGAGRDWRPVILDMESPADIGVDSKRRRVLIPLFMRNALAIRTLPN